jgi:uncharacterized integral membrane protein (TIGR00698 family)
MTAVTSAQTPAGPPDTSRWRRAIQAGGGVIPGILLCIAVTAVATGIERIEAQWAGRAWLEALVIAILVGTALRTAWTPGRRWAAGISFSAKMLLEIAVVLLGASISARTVLAAGPGLLFGIAAVVAIALTTSYGMGRLLGLPHRMATLIACGNSICGNSAIAASIAFTAVLGVVVVLALPLTVPLLHLSGLQYGALAGLTVYAVPQVLAATAPIGPLAVQLGTLVKLVRVLMLGPVVLVLSLLTRRMRDEPDEAAPHLTAGDRPKPGRLPLHKMVPWFIIGFLVLAAIRSVGWLPTETLAPIGAVANVLTVISMAALGLGTDLRVVARAGGRVTAAVTLSLIVLAGISLALIRLLGVA